MNQLMTLALIAGAAMMVAPAAAHHSFTQFDGSKTLLLDGTVTHFEWTNPHGWLWVSIAVGGNATEVWGAETKAVGGLIRDGWTKRSFRRGDKVKLYIHPMSNGTFAGEFIKAVFPDGKVIEPVGGSPGGPIGKVTTRPGAIPEN